MSAGRPRKEYTKEYFEKLCALQCTKSEIASFFEMSVSSLERRLYEAYGENFEAVYKKKSDKGRMSLRRRQLQIAMDGNVTMLIWLGKQYLNQTDKQDQVIHADFDGDESASKKYAEFAGRIFGELDQRKSKSRI